jgi:hypothetical protein
MKELVGDLINKFDSLSSQTVGDFNEIFTHCRLGEWKLDMEGNAIFEEYPKKWTVQIGEPMVGNSRRIILDGRVSIRHEMPPIYPQKKMKQGNRRPVTVDGREFDSISDAMRWYKLNPYNFAKQFDEVEDDEYVKKTNS